MTRARNLVLIALLTFTLSTFGQTNAPPSREPGGTNPSAGSVNPVPQSALLRILTPVNNERLNTNAITVRFQLTTPTATPGTPNFLVQLDGRTATRTTFTSQTFTGLAPGLHSVMVRLVDANGTPVQGGEAVVQFVVAPQNGSPQGATATNSSSLELAGFKFQQPSPEEAASQDLPQSGSPLPLISLIGFGILVGGIVSAMKNRT